MDLREIFSSVSSVAHISTDELSLDDFGCCVAFTNEGCLVFKLQCGPEDDGVGTEALIDAARRIIDNLNRKVPCRENAHVLTKLDEALHWLKARTEDRISRGVEGTLKV